MTDVEAVQYGLLLVAFGFLGVRVARTHDWRRTWALVWLAGSIIMVAVVLL